MSTPATDVYDQLKVNIKAFYAFNEEVRRYGIQNNPNSKQQFKTLWGGLTTQNMQHVQKGDPIFSMAHASAFGRKGGGKSDHPPVFASLNGYPVARSKITRYSLSSWLATGMRARNADDQEFWDARKVADREIRFVGVAQNHFDLATIKNGQQAVRVFGLVQIPNLTGQSIGAGTSLVWRLPGPGGNSVYVSHHPDEPPPAATLRDKSQVTAELVPYDPRASNVTPEYLREYFAITRSGVNADGSPAEPAGPFERHEYAEAHAVSVRNIAYLAITMYERNFAGIKAHAATGHLGAILGFDRLTPQQANAFRVSDQHAKDIGQPDIAGLNFGHALLHLSSGITNDRYVSFLPGKQPSENVKRAQANATEDELIAYHVEVYDRFISHYVGKVRRGARPGEFMDVELAHAA